ncbi:cyclophilin-like fold protein [Actinophytocola algeriensis]|uniref:Cyclophilin-like domain-containing protein n=1 Tax=Actinophytocola algeriensis TaxID=1768010 RepID=A0A7W7VHQ4_9PSEU|nr:cyclophilin-like fold protein [Actinophytocola algeriensis]MBB4910666.1 hypothetical protein [Actinophytocola algeriensis]MBE1473659.1 hypothetical protein [Actinophytocola algeriensis]
MNTLTTAAALTLALALTACNAPPGEDTASSGTSTLSPAPSAPGSSSPAPGGAPAESTGQDVVGTVVRFTAGSESVDVTIGEDSPATRDLLGMLPLTLTLEELGGREKIVDLPRELNHEGTPGSDPEDGDLIYFIPWGNLGFYYNAEGIEYSDQTLHLGTYDATAEELARLEGQVTVAIVP